MTRHIYEVQNPFLSATDLSTTADVHIAFQVTKGVDVTPFSLCGVWVLIGCHLG